MGIKTFVISNNHKLLVVTTPVPLLCVFNEIIFEEK